MNLKKYFNGRFVAVLAIATMFFLVILYALFIIFAITPQWNLRNQLAVQDQLALQPTDDATLVTPIAQPPLTRDRTLEIQVEQAQATMDQFKSIFLQESQVQEILNRLYLHASASNVEISNLQSIPAPTDNIREIYDVFLFRLQANGDLPQLLEFLSRLEETSVNSVNLTNLIIEKDGDGDKLTADYLFYSSPDADGSVVTLAPIIPDPTLTPQSEYDILVNQLDRLWMIEDWAEVTITLERILDLEPGNEKLVEKLVAAQINFGYQLVSEGDIEEARTAFEKALKIEPENSAALAGLQSIATELTPTPEATIYVVVRGDTIYSLSKRFGTTVDAVKEVNGLNNNTIFVGQVLNIPPSTNPN